MMKNQVQRLAELIRGIDSVMFTTINPDGSVNSRPMVVQDFEFDGELWFYTNRSSGKVDSIVEDSHVCIAFMDPQSNRYISVTGTADLIDDAYTMKKLWSDSYLKFFPEGPGGEDLALIRVRVTHAEFWDAPHSETMETFCFNQPPIHLQPGGLRREQFFHS